jgi:uncharacterized protein YcfJ
MKRFALVGLAMGLAISGSASAYQDDYGPQYDWARVVSVDPIIERYDVPVNRDVCYEEPVQYYEPRYAYRDGRHRDNTGATMLGALIGGALGNTVGHGDGRRAATIAGAVIGGSVANNNARRGGYYESGGYVRQGSREVCDTRTEYRSEEEIVGYDVAYRYNGRVYHTRTDTDPGERIRVAVDVDAVD